MFAKLMVGATAVLTVALFAYLGNRVITAYGEARYQSGLADGQLKQMPGILAANGKAMQAALDSRDRVITASAVHDAAIGRIIPQILSAQDKVTTYAASDAGRALCLAADRVRSIEADRHALFPDTASASANPDNPRPLPPEPTPNPGNSHFK